MKNKGCVNSDSIWAIVVGLVLFAIIGYYYLTETNRTNQEFELKKLELQARQATTQPIKVENK